MNPITRTHRLAVARAWEGDGQHVRQSIQDWADGKPWLNETGRLERLAQLVADAEGAWIPCEERLPEHQQMVLFWVSDWLPSCDPGLGAFVNGDHGQWWNDETQISGYGDDRDPKRYNTKGANARGVTHWRPLPKPPEQP